MALPGYTPGLDTLGNAASGSAVPVYNFSSGLYEYLVTRYYRLNNVDTTVIYRLTVASTVGNLANTGCNFITSSPKFVRTVNCNVVLPTQLTVKGDLLNGSLAHLQWTSRNETGDILYVVERSDDAGAHYQSLITLAGTASPGMGDSYIFNDPQPVTGQSFYRIEIIEHAYHNYSRVILLSNTEIGLNISGLVNPFIHTISFNLTVPEDRNIQLVLFDTYGRRLASSYQATYKGINHIEMNEPAGLQSGMYILQVLYRDQMITRQIIKRIN